MQTSHINCAWCGKSFPPEYKQTYWRGKKHNSKLKSKFCSDTCKRAKLSHVASLAVHEKADHTPNIPCDICGTLVYRWPSHAKKRKHVYCSRKCGGIGKSQEMKGNTFGAGIKQTPERIEHRMSFVRGEKSNWWNGGVTFHKGRSKKPYKYVKCPPDLQSMANKHGYVAEHRMVMARHLGRPLRREEVIHHVNHETLDNRLENLELFASHAAHKKHEAQSDYVKEYWNRIRTNRQNSA